MNDVKGKVIIVTGAAKGLGKAYSKYLSKFGGKLVLTDISPQVLVSASELNAEGGECIGIITDVTKEADTTSLAEETIRRFGKIDVLINNAAKFEGIVKKSFMDISPEEWDALMAVNLKGMFLCCRAVFPQMRTQGKGKIVNVSSGTFFNGAPYFLHYVTSKGGVVGFTRALARELGQYNITVNAIAPGFTETEAAMKMEGPEYAKSRANARSLKRVEKPEDLTGTVLYLCSEASDFLTGQTLLVNGGDTFH